MSVKIEDGCVEEKMSHMSFAARDAHGTTVYNNLTSVKALARLVVIWMQGRKLYLQEWSDSQRIQNIRTSVR